MTTESEWLKQITLENLTSACKMSWKTYFPEAS